MRFGIFYEHQLPRPWVPDDEYRLYSDALEQIELADRLGFDYVWEVEHHFLEEYSHSSAPEVFLGAVSQRTRRIRLGHGIVHAPAPVNHPARTAERIATLDLVSGGRVEFGTGEGSSAAELGGFGVSRQAKRQMWEEALDVMTRMLVEDPFCGFSGRYVRMPPRAIVPRVLQKPHPPLWVACSRRETIHLAARSGIGALSFSFVEPEDAKKWVTEYYDLIESPDCTPRGFAVNANVAVVLPMMVHPDEETAISRGIDGAHFFGYSLGHFYGGTHVVGGTDLGRSFGDDRGAQGFARELISANAAPLAVRLLQQGIGSLRGAIGTPAQVSDLLARYAAAGVDQVIFVMQAGRNTHEHICESLELFASEVLPRFADGREEQEARKAERLAPAIESALARRSAARVLPSPYPIDENAELARATRSGAATDGRPRRVGVARAAAGSAMDRAHATTRRLINGTPDDMLEKIFGSPRVQKLVFGQIAHRFDPSKAGGFTGSIVYDLGRGDGTRHVWTIEIVGSRAVARPGRAEPTSLTVRLPLTDFVRLTGTGGSFMPLIMDGTMTLSGDLGLANRLSDMFGGRSVY